jgi:basic membrane protein A
MKKFLSMVLLFMFIFTVGCSAGTKTEAPSQPDAAKTEAPKEEKKFKVALCLTGPINDNGFNSLAYKGLQEIEKNYGAEISYSESIQKSDFESVIRNYATSGYDVIFGHGFEFNDPMDKVSKEFPDKIFIVNSSTIQNGKNLGSIKVNTKEQGFIAGAAAALLSKNSTVGALGGMEIPPIQDAIAGFEAGAKYVKNDIKIKTGFTGSFDDAAKMKEMMTSYLQSGVDVGMANADQSGLGGIEAIKAANKIAIGMNGDQSTVAPKNVALSVGQSYPIAMNYVFGEIVKKSFEPKFYVLGAKEGAVFIMPNASFQIPTDAQAKLDEIVQALKDGKIEQVIIK